MKCPLCDGSVVNGRCRDCGMPYRNDEILYHLNEDRRSHEKHATDKAREELLKRMVPLGDMKQASGQVSGANTRKASGKTGQRNITRTADQKVKDKQKAAAKSKKEFGRSSNSSWSPEKKSKKKKALNRIIFWGLVVLVLVGPSIDGILSFWSDNETAVDSSSSGISSEGTAVYSIGNPEEQSPDSYSFSSWSDSDGRMEYGLNAGYGSIEVGEELPVGEYRIYTNNDMVKLLYKNADEKKAEVFELKEGDSLEMLLGKGDVLRLDGNGDSYKSVYFQELDR
ncbi:hypothetical protein [Blautia sp.]|jgi:hypothetical protein|uniref:hypothetical protein n=1 Tax=Blautia sp. TaxID=1955243 RepID=UPI0029421E1A|nr:hypothetical protein [Blautia sp.]MED9883192.1 hypothetical protein [Blautia sp.]